MSKCECGFCNGVEHEFSETLCAGCGYPSSRHRGEFAGCPDGGGQYTFGGPSRDQRPAGHPRFHELLREMAALHDRKNADYAHGGRPLGNFERVSLFLDQFPGLSLGDPVIVALTYLMKQLDAALWMLAQKHESKTGEDIGARLQDVGIYVVLARVLWEEGRDTG